MLSSSSSLQSLLSLVLLLSPLYHGGNVASAAKDTDYYFPGFVNPNTDYKMYWKDSINVLQDLDQFETLYVRYHHCVWSKYGTRYGTGEDYGDDDGGDGDNTDNGCGGWGGEYYWYMGETQCFKANAAYSLYGVLKGDDPKKKGGSFCHGDSYINSFFTTFGVESFAGPMGLGVDTANSYCVSQGGNDNDGNSGDNADDEYAEAKADDDYVGDDYTYKNYGEYMSSGVGCSAGGNFVVDQYNGAFCIGSNYNNTLDQLSDFNEAIREFDCTAIYSASSNQNGNNENRRLEDQDYDFENMNAIQILSYSKSCSLAQYPNDCPDPYGKKRKYGKNILKALSYKTGSRRDLATNAMNVTAWIFLAAALVLAGAANFVHKNDGKLMPRRLRKKKSRKRLSKDGVQPSSSKDSKDDGSLRSGNTTSDKSAASTSSKRSPGRKMARIFKLLRCEKPDTTDAVDDSQDTEIELADYEAYNTAPRSLLNPPTTPYVEDGQLMTQDNASIDKITVMDNGNAPPAPMDACNGFVFCGDAKDVEVNEDVSVSVPTESDELDAESLKESSVLQDDPTIEAIVDEATIDSNPWLVNEENAMDAEDDNDEGVEMNAEEVAKGKKRSSFLNKLRTNTRAQEPSDAKEGSRPKKMFSKSKKDTEASAPLTERARSVARSLSFKKKDSNTKSPGTKKKMLSFGKKNSKSKPTEDPPVEEEIPEPPQVKKVQLINAIKIILPDDDDDAAQAQAESSGENQGSSEQQSGSAPDASAEDDSKYLV